MQDKAFNLLHEPWIVVLNGEGMTETVSLLTVLERAHEFVGLAENCRPKTSRFAFAARGPVRNFLLGRYSWKLQLGLPRKRWNAG